MADIPLKSFTFPGLSDKYTTPVVDNTLTVAGAAADAKKTGDEIGAIKNDLSDGTLTVNNAQNAQQLTATVGIDDTAPYLFRTSGGSNDIGDREDVKKIVGGTIVNNQLITVQATASTGLIDGVTFTNETNHIHASGTATTTIANVYFNRTGLGNTVGGHIFMLFGCPSDGSASKYYNEPLMGAGADWTYGYPKDTGNGCIFVAKKTDGTNTNIYGVRFVIQNGTTLDKDVNAFLVDLTQMLGTTIADYVLSLETATAGAGVAWLKKHFPAQFDSGYQAYDAGSLQSVSGLTEHKMVGFNQWDEEWEQGTFNTTTGANIASTTQIRTKRLIPIIGGMEYCFTAPSGIWVMFLDADENPIPAVAPSAYYYTSGNSIQLGTDTNSRLFTAPINAKYAKFYCQNVYGSTYNHDICINLHWDGEKDGQYEPYKEYVYPLDSSLTLRGNPKVDASGNLYYDGDEYLPDGTINRRYGIVDLGTLNWRRYDFSGVYVFFVNLPDKLSGYVADGICSKYVVGSPTIPENLADKQMDIKNNQTYIYIRDDSYTTETDFINAVTGSYLVYTLATPTTETALPYQETQIVDDFGTEEFVLADTAFPVPVGHETYYQNNLRAKLEMSPDSPDGDGLYVVQQESGENTYVPLASTATIQDILTRLTALENA